MKSKLYKLFLNFKINTIRQYLFGFISINIIIVNLINKLEPLYCNSMCDCYKIPEKVRIKYNRLLSKKSEESIEETPIIITP